MRKTNTAVRKPAPIQPKEETKIAAPPPSMASSCGVKRMTEAAIRIRAYQKWSAAGKPPGDGVTFWLEAERELLQVK